MTRVVYLTHSGADSGAEQSAVSLSVGWPDPSRRPSLVLGGHGPIEARARRSGVDVTTIEIDPAVSATKRQGRMAGSLLGAMVRLVRHASKVQRVLEAKQVDVVVAISLKSLVFGRLAGRRAGALVVWSLHDRVSSDYFAWFVVPVLRYLVPRLVDGIVVNSTATRATIRPGRTPVLVSTPPVELDPREFRAPGDRIRKVVVLGRLSPWKGQDLFLRSFAAAFAGSDTEAFVIGGALFGETEYEAELRHEAERLGIADRVHFVGHVADPWAWLVDADVLVHSSRIPEPFGRVVVQGLWARCAVVATRPGGPAEVITPGVDGLLVTCDDEGEMTAALRELRDQPALAARLAARGRQTAKVYDASIAGARVHRFLEDVVRRRRGEGRDRRHDTLRPATEQAPKGRP